MRLAICGPGKCGKDEAAKFLASITNLRYLGSTSQAALDFVYKKWNSIEPGTYKTKEDFYADRNLHRSFWATTIDEYNQNDQARLYRDHVCNGSDFLTGIRRLRELKAAKNEGLFDLSIWIEKPDVPGDHTLDYTAIHCDISIHNHLSLNHFHYKLERLADALGIIRLGILARSREIKREGQTFVTDANK